MKLTIIVPAFNKEAYLASTLASIQSAAAGVTPETWEFTIGGYHPAEKWLKDRRRRPLTYEDIAHYRCICAALAETPRVMARIDQAIESHGGWPLRSG